MKTSLNLFLSAAGVMLLSEGARAASSKAAKASSAGVCKRRQELAFMYVTQGGGLIGKYFDDKGLDRSAIKSLDDVDSLCEFNSHASANQGCWALYEIGEEKGYVSSTDYFGEGNNAAKVVYEAIDEYCECFKGYESGCIVEAPFLEPNDVFVSQLVSGPYNTPAQYLDYCVFAGVTNKDFEGASLSSSAEKCGCFWVDAVEDEIDNCPGVEVGDFDA